MASFFGFATGASVSDEPIIPDEAELLRALRAAYRDPKITTTKAMHQVAQRTNLEMHKDPCTDQRPPACWQAVLDRNPKWSVNLKRVRRLLGKVVPNENGEAAGSKQDPDDKQEVKLLEEDVEDWCLITAAPPAAPAAKAVTTSVRSRRR